MTLFSGASSGSGGENEESEGTITDGETGIFSLNREIEVLRPVGQQNSLVFRADGTQLAAAVDYGQVPIAPVSSFKRCSGMTPVYDLFCGLRPTLRLWPKERTIFILGLENSGKSTLIALTNEFSGNVKLQAFDLGGHQTVRRVCNDYYGKVDGIVYVVNAAEREKFAESKEELDALLSDDSLAGIPVLIVGNTPGNLYAQVQTESQPMMVSVGPPASEDELRNSLGLSNYTTGKGKVNLGETNKRPIEVFMWCTGKKMGYKEGFKWRTGQKMGYEEGLKWLSQCMK